ncbi:MAG: hypothetical protein M3275_00990 [Thermoproteota archaeon]|nr:hypothetical protein [Thermoproteota archaeon]
MTRSYKITFAAVAAMAVVIAFAVAPALTSAAYAAPPGLREGCENQGGNEPRGQQGKCRGGGLDPFVENRGGNRPGGHN